MSAPEGDAAGPTVAAALEALEGARVEGASFVPFTGLLALALFHRGERRALCVGLGPAAVGLGLARRGPRAGRAPATHPLLAALRAHLVEHRVRHASVDDEGVLWLTAGGAGALARVGLRTGRAGFAEVRAADGRAVLRWGASEVTASAEPEPPAALAWLARDALEAGEALAGASEGAVARHWRSELSRALKQRAAAAQRRVDAVRGDLARLGDVAALQRVGRLLLAQGDAIPRGATKAALDDWETGGVVEVALDPALGAKAQAERFFAKARRYQRGEKVMRARLAEAQERALAAAALRDEARACGEEVSALEALSAKARAAGVAFTGLLAQLSAGTAAGGGGGGSGSGKAPREGGRRPYHKYRDARGRAVLVGRGGRDNDALLTQHARPHDLWLHAKGGQGAHVIVPLEKGASCPPELLVDAATLAAHFSDLRGEALCEVSYVERRHVRKPKGSPPGFVLFDREKVLPLRVEPERLERLLAARDEGA